MQPQVDQPGPTSGQGAGLMADRVGQYPGHVVPGKELLGLRQKPGRVARLRADGTGPALAQRMEEVSGRVLIECQAGGQLHQQVVQPRAQAAGLSQKIVKQGFAAHQLALMGDGLGQLGTEAEALGDAFGPACIGGPAVRTVKGGIDLAGVQTRGIALQVRALRTEGVLHRGWQAPARAAYVAQSRRHSDWRKTR